MFPSRLNAVTAIIANANKIKPFLPLHLVGIEIRAGKKLFCFTAKGLRKRCMAARTRPSPRKAIPAVGKGLRDFDPVVDEGRRDCDPDVDEGRRDWDPAADEGRRGWNRETVGGVATRGRGRVLVGTTAPSGRGTTDTYIHTLLLHV